MNKVLVNARLQISYDEENDTTQLRVKGNGHFLLTLEGCNVTNVKLSHWDNDGLIKKLCEVEFGVPVSLWDTQEISLPLVFKTVTDIANESILTSIGMECVNRGIYSYFNFYHEGRRTFQLRLNGNFVPTPKHFTLTEYPI